MSHVAVIGCGISGLRAAQCLLRSSQGRLEGITFFGREPVPGGWLSAAHRDGFRMERGAQGVLAQRPSVVRVLRDLGKEPLRLTRGRKWITRGGRLVRPLPGPSHLLALARSVLRPLPQLPGDPSLAAFVQGHLGESWKREFLAPMVSGIWGGGEDRILASLALPQLTERAGRMGLLRAVLCAPKVPAPFGRGMVSFPGGMGTLAAWLAQEIRSQKHVPVSWRLGESCGPIALGPKEFRIGGKSFSHLVVAAAPWEVDWGEEAFPNFPRHSFVSVGLGGRGPASKIRGFGALSAEFPDLCGVFVVHHLDPSACPQGTFFYRALLGGSRGEDCIHWSPERLIGTTTQRLQTLGLLGKDDSVEATLIARAQDAIPLPTFELAAAVSHGQSLEKRFPGLFLAGSWNPAHGFGVAGALASGERAGYALTELLGTTPRS